jgi:hypothetical protein
MLKLTAIVLIFLAFTGCASVKKRSSPLGDDRYLVNCDGNGYASTGDTMQCLAVRSQLIGYEVVSHIR